MHWSERGNLICECHPLNCEGHDIHECRWQIMRRAGWMTPDETKAHLQQTRLVDKKLDLLLERLGIENPTKGA
jgi:hypothetical protein